MTPAQISTIPFLRDAGGAALRDVAKHAIWYCVPSGSALFLDNEPADTIWFVLSGSLGAFRPGNEGKQEFVGYIRQGEPVGEFALIAGEPHSGSVYAMRDSEVLALDRSIFNRLIRRHPELMANLARTVLFRSRQNRRKNPRAEPRVFALICGSPSLDILARAKTLVEGLAKLGKRATIVGQEAHFYNSAWFDQIERDHDIVFLVAPEHTSAWANACRRRADRIWVLGRGDGAPIALGNKASQVSTTAVETFQLVDLVLIKSQGTQAETQTKDWMIATAAQRVFHWHDGDDQGVARLVRVMAGQSLGLVLGGGGARAFAHIGAIRALREAGYRFDFIGGTSMGGVVGACLALGWSDSEIERRIWDGFVANSPLDDYILPVVSLTAGRKVNQRLVQHFGDIDIENLLTPFYCVSSNLTTGSPTIHQVGKLREALRASIALPGILPPVVVGDDVLVDGAVLDNLPLSTMRDMHRGANIAIDVAQQHALDAEDFRHPLSFMSWVARHGFRRAPPIAELLMRSATAPVGTRARGTTPELLIVPELGDIQLRDWKAFDRAVEAGYTATVRALKSAPARLR